MHSWMKRARLSLLVLLFAGVASLPAQQSHSSSSEQLNQYVAELQKNPSDDALREKIIKLTLTMKQKPATPPEAYELSGRAKYAVEHATSAADFAAAAEAFGKALQLAPWAADFYFHQGVAQEKAQKLDLAIKSFEWYVMAAPDAQDVHSVRERIGGLKYAQEKAAAAVQQQTAADEAARRAQQSAQEQARLTDQRVQEQARQAQERRQKYPFEGTWEGTSDSGTPGYLSGERIRIWYNGSGWAAAYLNKDGSVNASAYPVSVGQAVANHIVLQVNRSDLGMVSSAELDLSADGLSLKGRALAMAGSLAAWERNHKTAWYPATLYRVGP